MHLVSHINYQDVKNKINLNKILNQILNPKY